MRKKKDEEPSIAEIFQSIKCIISGKANPSVEKKKKLYKESQMNIWLSIFIILLIAYYFYFL